VRAVFEAALQHDPRDRDAFLDEACAGRPSVRAEVVSLLDAHDRAGDFMEAPVFEAAAHLLVDDPVDSLEGRTIGPYLIRQEIGRGGMGVVYLADDVRLSRRVALKALAPGLGREATRRDRLRQEARAAAALSDPGIATIYALEEIDDALYLACEYVPGPTLRALLQRGPLGLDEVVDVATQLAKALAAAHVHGVVHRDLKPENVIRTPAGAVKILDFGVARTDSATQVRLTHAGTVLGTPAYMAPEQARGQDADFRTDVFSFGVLVYEMASGSNPFEAATPAAVIARVLEFEPAPLSEVSPSSPPWLDRIVATCLRKDPSERYRTTQELVADLERLQAAISADRAVGDSHPAIGRAAPRAPGMTPRRWWEVHQVAVTVAYVLMIYPAWHVRSWLPPPWGIRFLSAVVACAAAAIGLRLHLWFAARFYPTELPMQRARAMPWIRWCDAGFAACLLLAALAVGGAHPEVAALLVTVSVTAAVASFVIEPATMRAAFPDRASASLTPPGPRQ
jgi:eukaryotic-like serine/threonine-protein kinase